MGVSNCFKRVFFRLFMPSAGHNYELEKYCGRKTGGEIVEGIGWETEQCFLCAVNSALISKMVSEVLYLFKRRSYGAVEICRFIIYSKTSFNPWE